MKTREEQLKNGISSYDIDRSDMTQKVFAFAHALIKEYVPDAHEYLQAAMTRELLEAAAGKR